MEYLWWLLVIPWLATGWSGGYTLRRAHRQDWDGFSEGYCRVGLFFGPLFLAAAALIRVIERAEDSQPRSWF